MDNQKFNGNRIKEALQFRGMKMTELADKAGISKQSMSLYSSNKNTPPYESVIKIAEVLNLPYDYFMVDKPFEATIENTYFRSQSSATKKARNAQELKVEYAAKLYDILLSYVDCPELKLPEHLEMDIDCSINNYNPEEDAAKIEVLSANVRKYWNLGDGPIENLQYVLESNGIVVTGFRDVDSKIDAFSQLVEINGREIYVIALAIGSKPIERLRFDMAHELGHILMHQWGGDEEIISNEAFNIREKQANMFASSLLLLKNTFGRTVSAYPTEIEYYNTLKKKWKVSIQAMMYRARQLSIISGNQFQYMMRQISKNGWRTKEPGDVPGQLGDTIFQGAIDLLFDGGYITKNDLLSSFSKEGIFLDQSDLENLMCLREGTLDPEPKAIRLVALKK